MHTTTPCSSNFEMSQERENGPLSLSQWSYQVQKDDHRNVVRSYFTEHNLGRQQYLQPLYAKLRHHDEYYL